MKQLQQQQKENQYVCIKSAGRKWAHKSTCMYAQSEGLKVVDWSELSARGPSSSEGTGDIVSSGLDVNRHHMIPTNH